MLDTNILIYLMKFRSPAIVERIAALDDDDVVMSWVTYAQLLKGAEGSQRPEVVTGVLDELAAAIPVDYRVGPELCRIYGHHAHRLRRAGTPIGANDLWIGCHALSLGAVLVTTNLSEFSRIDGLDLRNWVRTTSRWSTAQRNGSAHRNS